jgi:hypothetical protein
MNKNTMNQTTTKEQELYNTANKAVYIALRARHEKSGLQFLAELQNQTANDNRAFNNRNIAEQITELEELHESHRKGFEFFNARANRLTLDAIERTTAFSLAEDLRAKAESERQQITTLYKELERTLSDRADLVQDAILKLLELEQEPAIVSTAILDQFQEGALIDELTEEQQAEAQSIANFKAVINAVGRAINNLASPEVLNSTKTRVQEATLEEIADYMLNYGYTNEQGQLTLDGVKIPHQTKRARESDCYITIEHRNTKTQQGYYKVYHYRTIAPYQYIEDFSTAEDGENDIEYLKVYNPFVSSYGDIDRIEELYQRANLTDRQRLFLEHFARACRYDNNFSNCKQYAFKQIGITTATNQTTFFNRLKKALNK